MVYFRSSRKISNYLVKAKLYLVERSVRSFNCKRPRQICAYVNATGNFTSVASGETFKITNRFGCMEKCFIYLLTCNKCRKQFAGQADDTFCYRWNNYKPNSFTNMHMAYHVCRNTSMNIFVIVNIVFFLTTSFIDKIDPSNSLQRENYWKQVAEYPATRANFQPKAQRKPTKRTYIFLKKIIPLVFWDGCW